VIDKYSGKRLRASKIYVQAVQNRAMPLGNQTT
jgi:uncharacterized membrane protein